MELISSCNFSQGTGDVYKVTKGERSFRGIKVKLILPVLTVM